MSKKKLKSNNSIVSFSVSPENYERFLSFFEENCIDRSKLIEKLIIKHMDTEEKKPSKKK